MTQVNSLSDISDKTLGELKSWLEPWFQAKTVAPSSQAWEKVGTGAGGGGGTAELMMVFDGGGSVLSTGVIGEASLDFACTITGWRLLADRVGSCVLDVWKDTYTNYPPTVADKITGSTPPTITSDDQAQSSVLTGWTIAVAAGDTFRFNLNSVSAIQRLTLVLSLARADGGGGTDFGAAVQVVPLPLLMFNADLAGFSYTHDSTYMNAGYVGCNSSTAYLTWLWYLGAKGAIYAIRFSQALGPDFAKATFSLASLLYQSSTRPAGDPSGKIQNALDYGSISHKDLSTVDCYSASASPTSPFNAQIPFIVGGNEGDPLTNVSAGIDPETGYNIIDGGPGWYSFKVRVNGRNASNTTGFKLRFSDMVLHRVDDEGFV